MVSYILNPGTGNLSYSSDKNQTSGCFWKLVIGWKEKLLREFGGFENVLHFVLDGGYMSVYKHQILPN